MLFCHSSYCTMCIIHPNLVFFTFYTIPLSPLCNFSFTCIRRDGPGWLALFVYLEIPIITFSLWCTKLLAGLMCRYGQKVTLVKKWDNYMPGKGVKLKIAIFSFLFRFDSRISLTAALTNMKLGREIKLHDLTKIM